MSSSAAWCSVSITCIVVGSSTSRTTTPIAMKRIVGSPLRASSTTRSPAACEHTASTRARA
eukprot:292731-Prymnesium_polylepis.1